MRESEIEQRLCDYLETLGWKITNSRKCAGEGGCDVTAFHQKWRKYLFVEVKGGPNSERLKNQYFHNGFYNMLGQILFRMDKQGNDQNKARRYSLAIPATWEKQLKSKVKQMPYGWKLLKLDVYLVSELEVIKRPHSYFLK